MGAGVLVETVLDLGSGWPVSLESYPRSPESGPSPHALSAFSEFLPDPPLAPPFAAGTAWRIHRTTLLEELLLALHRGFAFVGVSGGATRAELGFGASGAAAAVLSSRCLGQGA